MRGFQSYRKGDAVDTATVRHRSETKPRVRRRLSVMWRQGAYIPRPRRTIASTGRFACPGSATATTHERFALVLQAIPDPGGAPAMVRLERFLKVALRAYRLRCVRCEPLPAEQDHDAEAEAMNGSPSPNGANGGAGNVGSSIERGGVGGRMRAAPWSALRLSS